MNRDVARGSLRHVKGRAETAYGGLTGDLGRQAEGIVDQVAGGARYMYGRAAERAEDLSDFGSDMFDTAYDEGRARARTIAHYAQRHPAVAVAGIAGLAFMLGWFIRPTRRRSRR